MPKTKKTTGKAVKKTDQKSGLMDYETIKETSTVTEELDAKGVVTKRTKCEVYSRVVGYIRPVAQWNDGKQAEYADRKEFVVGDDCGC